MSGDGKQHRRKSDVWYMNGGLRNILVAAILGMMGWTATTMWQARDDVKRLVDTLPLAIKNIDQNIEAVKDKQTLMRSEVQELRERMTWVERNNGARFGNGQ